MTKHFTAVQFYGRILKMQVKKEEYNLIKYALDAVMINLHADSKKIATDVLLKLSNQINEL